MGDAFVGALEKKAEAEWLKAVGSLLPDIHEVDRNAVQIWFRFYPLDLLNYLESSDDPEEAMKGISMTGDFGVLDKIDTSHRFLYGHRYWPQVKEVITKRAETMDGVGDLANEIRTLTHLASVK